FNPISVPGLLRTGGLALQNWSGSEASEEPWLDRLAALLGGTSDSVLRFLELPTTHRALARRALLLDLRNLGTLGLQQDSFPALLWSDALHGTATLAPDDLAAIPPLYAARDLRQVLADSAAALRRPPGDAAAIARGRALFADRPVG